MSDSLPLEKRATDPDVRASLSAGLNEGVFAQVAITIVDYFMVPFFLFLGASSYQVGLLVAVPYLLASAAQILTPGFVVLMGSRTRLITKGALVQTLSLVPAALLAVVIFPGRIELFIAFIAAFRITGAIIGPAWGSLMSQYLPENKRGAYFGRRAQMMGLAGIGTVIFCGLFLFVSRKFNLAWGFAGLFGTAALFRLAATVYMNKLVDQPLKAVKEDDFTFWMFLKRYRESNFVKFTIFTAAITFTTHLAAPFFSVFMLKDLQFSYLNYMAVHLATLTAGLLSFSVWGRHADRYGNAHILKITGVMIPFIPALWLLSKNFGYLVFIEAIGGFVWAGFNLCALNFIYDAVAPGKRVRVLSYFNFINGNAICLGAFIGGYLAEVLPPFRGHVLYTLFILSATLRLLMWILLAGRFKEVRPVEETVSSFRLIYSVVGFRPLIGRDIDFPIFPLKRPSAKD